MKKRQPWRIILSESSEGANEQLEVFALLNLGLVQSLTCGVLSAKETIPHFYNADNCFFVRDHLKSKVANTIMSHGVQLPDLFNLLSGDEAQREFYHELEKIRSMSLKLLEKSRTQMVAESIS